MKPLSIGWLCCAATVACWPSLAQGNQAPNHGSVALAVSPGECRNFGRLRRRLPDANVPWRSDRVVVERTGGALLVTLASAAANSDGTITESGETIRLETCEEALEWTAFTLGLVLDEPEPERNAKDILPRPRPSGVAGPADAETRTEAPIAPNHLVLGIGGGFDGSAPSGSGAIATALIGFRLGHVRPTAFADWWAPGSTTTTLPSQGPVRWQQWAVGGALCTDSEAAWLADGVRLGLCFGARFNGIDLETEAAANGGTNEARWVTADLSLLSNYELVPGLGLELTPWLRVSPKPPAVDAGPGQLLEQPGFIDGRIHLAVVWQAFSGDPSAGITR